MKHFLLIAVFSLGCYTSVWAQWTVQPSVIIPQGFNSYLFKPGPMLEVGIKTGDDEDFYQFGAMLGYSILRPTADTFRTYATGGTGILPGYEAISTYSIFSVGVTNDFNILKKSKLSPVIGIDVYFYAISIAEHNYAEGLIDETTTGDSYWLMALCPRIGLRYYLGKNFLVSAGLAENISIVGTSDALPFIKPYVSVTFL